MELEEETQEYVSQNGETPEQTIKKLNKRFYKKDMEKYYSKYEEEVRTLKQNESEGENKHLLFNIARNKLTKRHDKLKKSVEQLIKLNSLKHVHLDENQMLRLNRKLGYLIKVFEDTVNLFTTEEKEKFKLTPITM